MSNRIDSIKTDILLEIDLPTINSRLGDTSTDDPAAQSSLIGDLSTLNTINKTSVVAAINSLASPISTITIKEFDEFTASADGAQTIPLPENTKYVWEVLILGNPDGNGKSLTSSVYRARYKIVNGNLQVTSDAGILAGNRIIGTCYIVVGDGSVTPPSNGNLYAQPGYMTNGYAQ